MNNKESILPEFEVGDLVMTDKCGWGVYNNSMGLVYEVKFSSNLGNGQIWWYSVIFSDNKTRRHCCNISSKITKIA